MTTVKYRVVPVDQLIKLEEARVKLYQLLETNNLLDSPPFLASLQAISDCMWYVANRKWPEARLTMENPDGQRSTEQLARRITGQMPDGATEPSSSCPDTTALVRIEPIEIGHIDHGRVDLLQYRDGLVRQDLLDLPDGTPVFAGHTTVILSDARLLSNAHSD